VLKRLRQRKRIQLLLGLLIGTAFGFLLQKGGLTNYGTIIGQLLLRDFTVLKVMVTAIVTGMLGIYVLRHFGLASLHPKPGSVGSSVIGGLLFGVGFGLLGYCPGTIAGAVGQGSIDALLGGAVGILIGAALFASLYPVLETAILHLGDFGKLTFPELLKTRSWVVVGSFVIGLTALLFLIEARGL